MQNVVSKEYSSPIKRLQIELSNPNTPRQYSHRAMTGQVGQIASTKNSYRTQVANLTERNHKPYDTVIGDTPRNQQHKNHPGTLEMSLTPLAQKAARNTRNIAQDQQTNK